MHKLTDHFTLALKIADQQIRFNIHLDDDQDALFQKIVDIYPPSANKR